MQRLNGRENSTTVDGLISGELMTEFSTKKRKKIKKIKIKRDEKKLIKWGEIEHDDNISFQNIEFPNKFLRMIVLESDTRLKCTFSLVYMYIYVYVVTSHEYVPF